jgi:hypothetical protein
MSLHPEGSFEMEVVNHVFGPDEKGIEKGNAPYIEILMRSEKGEVRDRWYFSKAALAYTHDKLKKIGWDGSEEELLDEECFAGNKFQARIYHQESQNGNAYAKMGKMWGIGELEPMPAGANNKSLAKLLMQRTAKLRTEDEVPF